MSESREDIEASPSVAVVIPLYNGAAFIAETLTSVHSQTVRPREVIVVDDGSDDAGPEIVRQHPVGARLLRQSHLGVAVARNRGLAETRCDWVAFLDQDDLWHPTRLERLLSWLEQHPGERLVATTEIAFSTADELAGLQAVDELVGSWASHVVPASTAFRTLCERVDTRGTDEVGYVDHRAMLLGPITVTTSFLADAGLLRCAGGFAPHALAMDDYWLLVNAARLYPIAKVDQPTVFYRIHLGATSRSTRLALPFLSSAVALRLGGGLLPADEGLEESTGPFHDHLLDELLRSPEYRHDPRTRAAARHLAALLWRNHKRPERLRTAVKSRAPWAASTVRRLRHRGGSV